METQVEHATEIAEPMAAPPKPKLVNGVRICRAVLAVAAVALAGSAIAWSKPFYGILAFGCVVAIFVRVRNVRSILAGFAAAEGMYFVANLFSPEGGRAFENVVLATGAVLVTVAIVRLRHWESADGTDLHSGLRLAAVAFGLLLLINVALVVTAPISSSQYGASTTNSQCGSVMTHRTFKDAWAGVLIPQLNHDCNGARGDRIAFAFIQVEVAVGLLYVGWAALRRQPRRVYACTVILVVLAGSIGQFWSNAAVTNANKHDAAFAPWFNAYSDDFGQLTLANSSLSAALHSGNADDIITACTQLEAIDDSLASSVAAWPSSDSADRSTWKSFLTQHRADAGNCIQSEMKAGSHSANWFANSANTLGKLRHAISYW